MRSRRAKLHETTYQVTYIMDSFTVYKTYLALRAHFTTDNYDIFEMQGRVRASKKAFSNRKDLFSIEKISKKYSDAEVVNLLVANFVSGNRWGGVFDGDAHEVYLNWLGIQERLHYQFKQDLDTLVGYTDDWIDLCEGTGHPYIIKAYLGQRICLETLCILDQLTDSGISGLDIDDAVIWPDLKRLIIKYKPFLKYDSNRYGKDFRSRIRFNSDQVKSHGRASSSNAGAADCSARTNRKHDVEYQRNTTIPNKASKKSTRFNQENFSVALSNYFQ